MFSEMPWVIVDHRSITKVYGVLWHWAGEHIGSIIDLCVFFCLFQCNTITAVPLLWVCRRLWAAALSAVNSVEQITLMPHNHSYITHTLILCFDFTFSSLNSTQLCFQCSIVGKVRLRFAFISHRWQSNKVSCHVCGSFWFWLHFSSYPQVHWIGNFPYQSFQQMISTDSRLELASYCFTMEQMISYKSKSVVKQCVFLGGYAWRDQQWCDFGCLFKLVGHKVKW